MKKARPKVHNDFDNVFKTPQELRCYLSQYEPGLRSKDLDYRIVIPSRKRPHLMGTVLRLLPTAYVSVAEDEVEQYKACGVSESRIMAHPNGVNTLAKKRNWIWDNCSEEGVVQIDDDFQALVWRIGQKPRRFKDPGAILQVIENGFRVAKDMGAPAFCWARTINISQGQFNEGDPLTLNPMLSNAWGQIGRKYKADLNIQCRPDIDLSLQMLLRDRFFFMDERAYFDCGVIFAGAGGSQGVRTSDIDRQDLEYIVRKWGKYVKVGQKNVSGSHRMRVDVERRSPLAFRG